MAIYPFDPVTGNQLIYNEMPFYPSEPMTQKEVDERSKILNKSKEANIDEKAKEVLRIVFDGHSIKTASGRTGLHYQKCRKIAIEAGWNVSFRDKKLLNKKGLKKSTISVEEILDRYDKGESQSSIARDAGVSRERVRQIIIENDRLGQREKSRLVKQSQAPYLNLIKVLKSILKQRKKEENKRIRYESDLVKWQKARELWDQDVEISEMVKELKIKESNLKWYIGKLRSKYGWFPNRKPFGHHRKQVISKEDLISKNKELIQLYDQGLSYQKIGNIIGKPKSWVAYRVSKLRKFGICKKK